MRIVLCSIVATFAFVFALALASGLADEERPAQEAKAEAKPDEPKAEAAPEEQAKQAVQAVEALGAVLNVFAGAVGGEIVGLDPLEQQFLQQFRQLGTTEVNFVRAVCRPNAEQSKKIKAASEVAVRSATKKFAEIQKKMQQGMRVGEQPEWPDPRKLMADVLLKTVKESFTEEQAKLYEVELAKRAAARKRVVLMNLVARLDRELVLTKDQRDKLIDAVNANWNSSWEQQLEVFLYGDSYMPALPDAQVVPILTDKQKQIWTATPKQQNQIWGWAGFGFVQAVAVEEVVVEAADPADVPVKAVIEKNLDEKKDDQKEEKP